MSEENMDNQGAAAPEEPVEQPVAEQAPEPTQEPAPASDQPAAVAAKPGLKERLSAVFSGKKKKIIIGGGIVAVLAVAGLVWTNLSGDSEEIPPAMQKAMEQAAAKAAKAEPAKPAPETAKPAAEAAKPAEEKKPELTPEQKAAAEAFRKTVDECLGDGDWVVRRDAVAAIGHLRLKEFVPQLNKMTRDRNAAVRSEASKALLKVRYGN